MKRSIRGVHPRARAAHLMALGLLAGALAGPTASADNCDLRINPDDCQNTAWTVGTAATLAATAAVTAAAAGGILTGNGGLAGGGGEIGGPGGAAAGPGEPTQPAQKRTIFGRRGQGRLGQPVPGARTESPPGYRWEPVPQPKLYPTTWEAVGGQPYPGLTTQPVPGVQPVEGFPPSPIGPGGQPIGGLGIHAPPPPLNPGLENLQLGLGPGWVQLQWAPPPFDSSQVDLLGYRIWREQLVPNSTAPVRELAGVAPPGANAWGEPFQQTFQHSTGGDRVAYQVEPVYEMTRDLTRGQPPFGVREGVPIHGPRAGDVVYGPPTRAPIPLR